MKRFLLLETCARITGNSAQHEKLRGFCQEFSDWENLLRQAELEGMIPLLKKHLEESGSNYPPSIRRSLQLLARRHQQEAELRGVVFQEVLHILKTQGLEPIVLKGAALARILYPDPALRPMRDIDLLFDRADVEKAQNLLIQNGFSQAVMPIPEDHFHLLPLFRDVGNTKICIEIHRGLYPDCPPYYPDVDFENLLKTGRSFIIGTTEVKTMSDEEMLFYLFQHAFRMPLTYEPYKLINLADIVGFIEQNVHKLDWDRIMGISPLFYRALPLIHHLVPLPSELMARYPADVMQVPPGAGEPYQGWPRLRFSGLQGRERWSLLRKTIFPSEWWCRLYYGADTAAKLRRCRLFSHPRHVLWWVHLYRTLSVGF